jgi:hypothetical protein
MFAREAAVREDGRIGAISVLERLRERGQALEGARLIDRTGQFVDDAAIPRKPHACADGSGTEGITDDVTKQDTLICLLTSVTLPIVQPAIARRSLSCRGRRPVGKTPQLRV